MFDLGDVVPLGIDITNASGNPANAGAVTLTIGLPDGTTTSPTPTNPSTGRYEYDYPTVQPGRHTVRWVATGGNAGAYTDAFDVGEASPPLIVSLADTKRHLNQTTTTQDDEVRGFIGTATDIIEDLCGPVVVRTFSERIEGCGPTIVLSHTPLVAVTSIVSIRPSGPAYDMANVDVDLPTGVLELLDGTWFRGSLRALYKAGRPVVPRALRLAALVIIQHMWRTQLGSSTAARRRDRGDDYAEPIPGMGYSIPNRAMELMGPFLREPLVG